MSDSEIGTAADSDILIDDETPSGPDISDDHLTDANADKSGGEPAPRSTTPPGPGAPRGPRLVPGAAVAGGRYRLLEHHGGTRGLQFWRAIDTNLDREVALTFVDAEQSAEPLRRGESVKPSDDGPQAVLSRTLRLGQISSPGVARVLDVVRGSSGGIVVSEWVTGSSLAEVAETDPSPIASARAVRALAGAAEAAHRSGGALSIDHPDRIRISSDGNAVLAFPGTLADDDKSTDVRGLGAVLYALLLARWPLDAATGTQLVTTDQTTAPIGGLPAAEPDDNGHPIEPRTARPDTPFEISAVAARALEGNHGIRTAGTVQHVLDQATVVDLPTDMLPAVDAGEQPYEVSAPRARPGDGVTPPNRRNLFLLIGAGVLVLLIAIGVVSWAGGVFGGGNGSTDINSIITTTSAAPPPATPSPVAGPIALSGVTLVDFSGQPPDSSVNLANVISGAAPAWRTDQYRGSPVFGGLKAGLGLMFPVGPNTSVKSITIKSPTPGFAVSIRTANDARPNSLDATQQVASGTVSDPTTTLHIDDPQPAPYLMVWITSLPQTANGYQAQIGQITMSR